MPTTVTQLANTLATEAGEDYTDAQVADLYKTWVKEAYINTAGSSRFLWQNDAFSIATTNSVAEYTLDADVAEVKIIRNDDTNTVIGYNTEESLARLNTDFTATGTPLYWFYSGIDATSTAYKIQLVPVPNATINLDVRALVRPSELGDAAVIPLPIEYVELMKNYVRSMYQLNDNQIQLAGATMAAYNERLGAYNTRYTQPRQVSSRLRIKNLSGTPQAPAAAAM